MIEGALKGHKGLFPINCVQEVRLRNPEGMRMAQTSRVTGRREARETLSNINTGKDQLYVFLMIEKMGLA